MAFKHVSQCILNLDLPRARVESERDVKKRLSDHLARLRATRPQAASPRFDDFDDDLDELLNADPQRPRALLNMSDHARIAARAQAYWSARQAAIAGKLGHLKEPDQKSILRAVAGGTVATGVMSAHSADEQISLLHQEFPWLAPASVEIMRHMRRRTVSGPAAAHTPPLIVLGPPGIAKSSWARRLARLFDVTPINIDVGATNGATFSISGVEKGWGSAAPGRVISTMLRDRVANPVVIIDELDKIPESVGTSGGRMPGAFEVLKSMIEPSTAKAWVCPFYQLPFDLTGVSWIMTTNSLDGLPAALLDRCKIVRVDYPSVDQLYDAGARLIAIEITEGDQETALSVLRRGLQDRQRSGHPTSLRDINRMIDVIASGLTRQYQM